LLNAFDILIDLNEIANDNQIGIFTILGTSGFQVLVVTGVVVMSLASPKAKKIINIDAYLTLSVFSVFGLLWIYISFEKLSPSIVSFPEAFFGCSLFFVMVLVLYALDCARKQRLPQYYDRLLCV